MTARRIARTAVIIFAVVAAVALHAPAQDNDAPEAPPPSPAAQPADALSAARARQQELAVDAARTRTESGERIDRLTKERGVLAARLEAATEEERPSLQARIAVLERRMDLAQERTRASEALLVAQRRLVSTLEARARREADGAAAFGITIPTTGPEIDAALVAITDARAALAELERAGSGSATERDARADELAAAAAALAAAQDTLRALPEEAADRAAAQDTVTTRTEERATAELRHALALVSADVAALRLTEAREVLRLREAALDAADTDTVTRARARQTEARERAEVEAEARRREEDERARDELARMRADAAIEAEAARVALEDVRSPEVRRVLRLRMENAERTGALADLEERRREVEARLVGANDAWRIEREALAARVVEAAAGRLGTEQISDHLAEVRGRRDAVDGEELVTLQAREESASEAAGGYRTARARAGEALAAFQADPMPEGRLRSSTLRELQRGADLTAALFEAARDTAWAFDRLAELRQERFARYDAHLANSAFDILYLGNSTEQLWRAGSLALGTVVLGLIVGFLLRVLLAFTRTTRFTFDEYVVKRLARPARMAVYLVGAHLVLRVLSMPDGLRYACEQSLTVLVVINVVYAVYNLVDILVHALEPVVERTESRLDDQLLPLVGKIVKLLVVVVGVVEGARVFGYNLTTVLAGVGVGGIAVALAARDTVANLFGSIMIFTDKPFEVGDWVKLPGCEGVVEGIGLRSTKVRTWEDTVVTIPNSTIGSASIENVSRFKSRRFKLDLGLRYDTPVAKLERAVEIVREVLEARNDIKDGAYVFFNDLKPSSLNVMMYSFVKFTVWRQYLTARQEVTMEIMRRFAAEGIRFAFPTQTVELEAAAGVAATPPGAQTP
jgi:MscS family membrane protein